MPNCELRRCALKGCRNEFRPKREAQVYCKAACRNAAHKRPKKRRLALERVDILRSVANGPFSARKSVCCKDPHLLEIGASVRAQILAQKDQPDPISFTTPDGIKGRVSLGVGAQCAKGKWQGGSKRIIGNDLHWGMTVKKAFEDDQSAIQRERRKWPVDLMGGNRRGKITPAGCVKPSWTLSASCLEGEFGSTDASMGWLSRRGVSRSDFATRSRGAPFFFAEAA